MWICQQIIALVHVWLLGTCGSQMFITAKWYNESESMVPDSGMVTNNMHRLDNIHGIQCIKMYRLDNMHGIQCIKMYRQKVKTMGLLLPKIERQGFNDTSCRLECRGERESLRSSNPAGKWFWCHMTTDHFFDWLRERVSSFPIKEGNWVKPSYAVQGGSGQCGLESCQTASYS